MTKDMSMTELVALIELSGKELAQMMLKSRLAEDPRSDPPEPLCRKCKSKLRIQEHAQRRVLNTAIGEIEYRRAYGVCDQCGHTGAPLDEALGIPSFGPSVEVMRKISHAAATARSFGMAADILKEHAGIEMSAKQVRVNGEAEGARVAAARALEVESFRRGAEVVGPSAAPDLIVVTADGGRVQTRQCDDDVEGGVWKENKVGAIYNASPRKDPAARDTEEYDGAKALTKTYAATMQSWEEFGYMLRVEAHKRGYVEAKEKLFISDGAKSLKTFRQTHFPEATFILDWYHSAEHISACSKAAFGEGTEEQVAWYKRVKKKLWLGNLDGVIASIEKESARDEKEVKGYYQALAGIEDLARREARITENHIRGIHGQVMGAGEKRRATTPYRDGQNVIKDSLSGRIVYLPPEAKDVPPLMVKLVKWLTSNADVVPCPLRAAIAHYQFATIHPYYDGNGRPARLLTNLVLHLGGYGLKGIYSLEEYYARDLQAYYAAIAVGPSHNYYEGRAEADITAWLEYFVAGMGEAFAKVEEQAKAAETRWETDKSPVLRKLDPRQRKALVLFARQQAITSREISLLFSSAPRTARLLLQQWTEQGFLTISDPSKKARKYKLAPEFEKLF